MTKSEWLEIVKKVRGNWDGFCVDKQKFDTFLDALKEFDVRHVREAADRIIKGYAYPPIVATFTVYIKQVQKDERYRVDRQRAEKKEIEGAKRKPGPANDHGWFRFTRWMLEKRNQWPKKRNDLEKLKVKFEREYPDWQPRKKSQPRRSVQGRGGITKIGNVMKDAIGNLE
ncbi:MAG: hypothetical protein IMF11_20200 [Proteobacteria bacterium]|nr:hypothetical protein [Pseudomonadota bacterium]